MPKNMTIANLVWRGCVALAGTTLATVLSFAQSVSHIPLKTAPTEKFTVNPGFRDWAPTTIAGTIIIGGNSSNRGGLFAVDIQTGKLKWTSRPTGSSHGNPFVSTKPAVSGNIVIVPMGHTLVALALATGREIWRGPVTAPGATVTADSDSAYVLGDDNNFYALDAATGRQKWKVAFSRGNGSCDSVPVVRGGIVYVTGSVLVAPVEANKPATYHRHLFALDANTGKERWRYSSAPIGNRGGVCFTQPIVTGDTFFAVADATLYAVNLSTGRERWMLDVHRPVEGRDRAVPVHGLVDAGSVLIGLTSGYLIAFDKASGRTAWELPGQYRENSPSTAVAGTVLYFQGHPGAEPAAEVQGRIRYIGGRPVNQPPALPPGKLNALDLNTRSILWSFSRTTAEANWPFGFVTPVDGGVWVDSYQALVKLQ